MRQFGLLADIFKKVSPPAERHIAADETAFDSGRPNSTYVRGV